MNHQQVFLTVIFTATLCVMLFSSCGTQDQKDSATRYGEDKGHSTMKFLNSDVKPTSPPACAIISAYSLDNVQYNAQPQTWGDAVNNAPRGMRLATRGELMLLFDNGSLKMKDQVWSASGKNDDESYVINTIDGSLNFSHKNNLLGVVYVERK